MHDQTKPSETTWVLPPRASLEPASAQTILSANSRADYQRARLRLETRIYVCFPQSRGGQS